LKGGQFVLLGSSPDGRIQGDFAKLAEEVCLPSLALLQAVTLHRQPVTLQSQSVRRSQAVTLLAQAVTLHSQAVIVHWEPVLFLRWYGP